MRIMASSEVAGAGQVMLMSNAKSRQLIGIQSLCSNTSLFELKHAKIKKQLQFRDMGERIKPLKFVALSRNDDQENINISSLFPSDTIKQFYVAINEKNFEEIKGLLSDDCFFEDFSFPIAFQGKKETMHFLEHLVTSMGENIEFNVENILEGEGHHAAAVNWHLEWKKRHVPLTRGSSYFEFSRIQDKLLIKKARVIVESPIKPGGFGLAHFSIVTSLFDAFPEATEAFLKKPHFIYQILMKAYFMGCKRIVDPLLEFYIKLLNYTVRLLRFLFKFLHYVVQMILARRRSDEE